MADSALQNFIETYEREKPSLPGASGWLAQRRDEAASALASAGLPHRRLEEWKYTDLRQMLRSASLAPAPDHKGAVLLPERSSSTAFSGIEGSRIVFVNGRYRSDLSDLASLSEGVSISPVADVLGEDWARALLSRRFDERGQAENIIDLNTALMRDGICLELAEGVAVSAPLHFVWIAADDGSSHVRNLIRLGEGARASIIESHIGDASSFSDIVTDVSMGKRASLDLLSLQDRAESSIHISSLRVDVAEGASFSSFAMALRGGITRNQAFVRFTGEHASAHVNGVYALDGKQHFDQFCVMDHAVPHCASHTLFKGVLNGASEAAFQGRVVVRPDAQKTDGRQATHALLLSRDASMNAKPELEIYADDVQCAHGSTVGELSRAAIFYLRSRGIPEQEARKLLIFAFLDEVIELAPVEAAHEVLKGLVAEWFAGVQS